jgi:hypothetical protein
VFLGDLERRRRAVDAGIVDEDVDPPELAARALDHRGEVGTLGDVGGGGDGASSHLPYLGGGAFRAGAIQLGDDDVRAQLCQLERGGASDAAARAGDDGDLSFQLHGGSPGEGDPAPRV